MAAQSEKLGSPSVIAPEADVRGDTAPRAVSAAIDNAWDGHLDLLVNNAGMYSDGLHQRPRGAERCLGHQSARADP